MTQKISEHSEKEWTVEDALEATTFNINTGKYVLQMVTDDYQMAVDICDAHNASLASLREEGRVLAMRLLQSDILLDDTEETAISLFVTNAPPAQNLSAAPEWWVPKLTRKYMESGEAPSADKAGDAIGQNPHSEKCKCHICDPMSQAPTFPLDDAAPVAQSDGVHVLNARVQELAHELCQLQEAITGHKIGTPGWPSTIEQLIETANRQRLSLLAPIRELHLG